VKGKYEMTARISAAAQFTGTWILLGTALQVYGETTEDLVERKLV
jgi:hypothetical protein